MTGAHCRARHEGTPGKERVDVYPVAAVPLAAHGGYHTKAILVQSVRLHGQPRQRHICYLGAIRVRYQQAPAHRQRFWARVDQRLATLGLAPETRARLETALARQVARPTPADLMLLDAQRAALYQMAATIGPRHGL